jgi:hypothetical protein
MTLKEQDKQKENVFANIKDRFDNLYHSVNNLLKNSVRLHFISKFKGLFKLIISRRKENKVMKPKIAKVKIRKRENEPERTVKRRVQGKRDSIDLGAQKESMMHDSQLKIAMDESAERIQNLEVKIQELRNAKDEK